MIEIRLRGLLDELEVMVDTLKQNYNVIFVSKPYKDRGDSEQWRIYLKVESINVLE